MSYIDADNNDKLKKFFSQYERYDPELLKIIFNIHKYTFEPVTMDKGSFLEFIYDAYKTAIFDGLNIGLDMAVKAIQEREMPQKIMEEEIEILAEKHLEKFLKELENSDE